MVTVGSLPSGFDLSKIPLASSPNGAPPNFIDPPSLEPAILSVGVTLTVISGIAVSLRIAANLKHIGKLGLDDGFCIIGELTGIAYWAIIYSFAHEGAARHQWDVPVSIVTESFIKRTSVLQVVYYIGVWAAKAAVFAMYIKVFGSVQWMRYILYCLMITMSILYTSNLIIAIVFCFPHEGGAWESVQLATCGKQLKYTFAIAIAVFGIVADLFIFIVPALLISKLQLTRRKKIEITALLSLASFTTITTVVGLAFKIVVANGQDWTWNGMNVGISMGTEIFGTVIVSCAPALSSFWRHIFTKTRFYTNISSKFLAIRDIHRNQDPPEDMGPDDTSLVLINVHSMTSDPTTTNQTVQQMR